MDLFFFLEDPRPQAHCNKGAVCICSEVYFNLVLSIETRIGSFSKGYLEKKVYLVVPLIHCKIK